MACKEWRAPFYEDAVVEFDRSGPKVPVLNKIAKGELAYKDEKRRKHLRISKKQATWYTNYLLESSAKYGVKYDNGKLSRSNDPRFDQYHKKGCTMRYIFDKMDGNVKFVTRQVRHLLNIDYLVKFDEYVGYEKFYIAVTFVDEEL